MQPNKDFFNQFEKEQYNDQANLVYINTFVSCLILAPIFQFWIGSTLLAVLTLFSAFSAFVAIQLNRRQRYGLSALLYFVVFNITLSVEITLFGFHAGFQYLFFNYVGLMMFTSWKPWQKLMGVLMETGLFLVLFFLNYDQVPPIQLGFAATAFFHTLNILMNVAGVANSANYFIRIAKRAHRRIHDLATKDYLTNLMNRTSFDSITAEMFGSQKTNSSPLGVLLLDIDHFKRVNDTCGHLCGDELLRQFASILSSSVRSKDYVARYGGEEFVILVAIEKIVELEEFAERLRNRIENHVFVFKDDKRQITASIGALYLPPAANIEWVQALNRADEMLYQAKEQGRNRVVCAAAK